MTCWRNDLERDGFVTLAGVYDGAEVARLLASLEAAMAAGDPGIRGDEGAVYAARNVIDWWPPAAQVWKRPPLREALLEALGERMGLVRALYFDKPPGQSWALPWHKDMTIAVKDNALPTTHFRKPTTKAGVPHVEGSEAVLAAMLTARVHLDDVSDENGPLKVVPGSHRSGKAMADLDGPIRTLHARAGDVLLIRPLVAHCSNRSLAGTGRHRRILHLEFAASAELPDGYEWHDFLR
jgi:hypothetical protein